MECFLPHLLIGKQFRLSDESNSLAILKDLKIVRVSMNPEATRADMSGLLCGLNMPETGFCVLFCF